ncbi:MAG: PEP-CTERM sorting domain-containing protein, partial [Methylophilus sp.]|nr:PEP-CTERM sorting domain-containing protein [Methylophilus sp.]
ENTQGDIRGAQWVHPLTPAFDMGSLNGTGSPNNNLNSFGLTVGNDGTNATIFTSISSRVYLQNEYGTYGNAMAINDKYQVVGAFSDDAKGAYFAGIWGDGPTVKNLGSLGGNGSWAYDINESSQIVGFARRSDDYIHAAIWSDNKIKDLGTLGGDFSSAYGINNRGQVVGMSTEVGIFETYATLWDGDSIINLNDYLDNSYTQDGWILREALEINDSGWIVGNAFNSNLGLTKGFVLSVSQVPEPDSYAMFFAGLLVISVFRKFKR